MKLTTCANQHNENSHLINIVSLVSLLINLLLFKWVAQSFLILLRYFFFKRIFFLLFLAKDYGLFLADEDQKKGVWLEPGRNLDYYILRNGDLLEYKKKLRTLRVRMLDGTLKTLLVDDSQPVANLMVVICTKIGN